MLLANTPHRYARRMLALPPVARLFVALWPDLATRDRLVELQAQARWSPQARLTTPDHLHLTLHFIGGMPRDQIPLIATALDGPAPAVEFNLSQTDVWLNGAAVVEPDSWPAVLDALHQRLGQALQQCDVALDTRPWRPHVTLARKAVGSTWPAVSTCSTPWRSQGYVLVESRQGYHPLRHFA
jgi:2'-5' RNA ligase